MQVMVPEDLREHMAPTSSLVPYVGNAKRHPDWQVEQIARSIEAFGFSDPIAVWHDVAGHPIIVEGHGRLLAAKLLGLEEVPVITLDHLDDEGRRAYTLAHNKLTMNTEFDLQLLDSELDAIEGLDMGEFGFEVEEPSQEYEPKYSQEVLRPVYEPTGDMPSIGELVDKSKMEEALGAVRDMSVPDEISEFLELAATRLLEFDYTKVAEFYSHSDEHVRAAFERLLLVIVDREQAIELGYCSLMSKLDRMREEQTNG